MVREVNRRGLVIAVVVALGLAASGIGLTAHNERSKLRATLNATNEVPKQAVATPAAVGKFVGTLTESGSSKTIKWTLTFGKLSGPAGAAHIHLGKPGKAGAVIVPLCGPCKSGAHGTVKVTEKIVKAIESGAAYVNVHTAKNPAGEIRGQLAYG